MKLEDIREIVRGMGTPTETTGVSPDRPGMNRATGLTELLEAHVTGMADATRKVEER